MGNKKIVLLFHLLLMGSSFSYGQEECVKLFTTLSSDFEKGDLTSVVESGLDSCLTVESNNENRILAYQLLAKAYTLRNDQNKARDNYFKLLKINPFYKPDLKNEPILYYLSKEFQAHRKFSIGLHNGVSFTFIQVQDQNTSPNTTLISEKYSNLDIKKVVPRWGYSFFGEINLFQSPFDLGCELRYNAQAYLYEGNYNILIDGATPATSNIKFQEVQSWYSIPLYIKYQKKIGKGFINKLYIYTGGGIHFQGAVELTAIEISTIPEIDQLPVNSLFVTENRSKINYSVMGGLGLIGNMDGLSKGAKGVYFFGDIRFSQKLNNVLSSSKPVNELLDNNLYYRDNDFTTNHLLFSIGIGVSFYEVQKLK